MSKNVAKYSKTKYDIATYPQKQVYKVIKQLSISQTALKSMDGATHKLGNTFKDKLVPMISYATEVQL